MGAQVEEVALRLRADGVLETDRGLALVTGELGRLGKAADAASPQLQRMGASAGQTQAAMRQLPAQITDIWTSLASGQAPMTVFIQQGGQIKDSFGGVVPAARALASTLTPLNVALGVGAGAIGALAMAYVQGQQEGDAFARSIIFTGNAAGTSMSQLNAMAQALDGVAGSQHKAAGVLAQLAGTGQVAAASLQQFAETAMRLDRVGVPIEETVKQFTELGKAPIDASVKLNQQINHLTKSVYDQIVALEKQGRTAEAAEVAQRAFNDAQRGRADQMEERLGSLQRGWRNVGDAASWAWNMMLGIGREDTLVDKLKKAEKELADFEANMPKAPNAMVDSQRLALMQARRDTLRSTVDSLRMEVYMEGEVAAIQGAANERNRRAIADAEDLRKRKGGAGAEKKPWEITSWSAYSTWGAGGRAEVGYAAELERQAAEDRAKAIDEQTRLIDRSAQATEREASTLANHTAELGLNAEQLLARRQALVDQQISDAAALLSVVEGARGYEDQTAALRRQIAALQDLRQLQGQAFVRQQVVDEQKAAEKTRADEEAQNRRRAEGIATSIEDGLMTGFRKGRSLSDIFLGELKAQFARTVLRPVISPIAGALAGVGGGGSGLLSGLLGLMSGGNPLLGATGFGDYNSSALLAAERHSGGMAMEPGLVQRTLHPSVFSNAPRFHTGIGPHELPAVIKRDEGVFTPGQMRALAPVSELAKAGPRLTYSPTFHIDSRTDRAEVLAQVQAMTRQSQAELLDMMDRRMA